MNEVYYYEYLHRQIDTAIRWSLRHPDPAPKDKADNDCRLHMAKAALVMAQHRERDVVQAMLEEAGRELERGQLNPSFYVRLCKIAESSNPAKEVEKV